MGAPAARGPPKAALVEIQADEYGGGRPERMHAQLFADAMAALGLDSGYGAYLDSAARRDARDRESDVACADCTAACAGRSSGTWRSSR